MKDKKKIKFEQDRAKSNLAQAVEYRKTLEWVINALEMNMDYLRIEEEIRHVLAPKDD